MKFLFNRTAVLFGLLIFAVLLCSCTGTSGGAGGGNDLVVAEIDESEQDSIDAEKDKEPQIHDLFKGEPGDIPSGVNASLHDIYYDYDGDGISNDEEIVTNPYVADYPRIVTRISAPITMEIRVSAQQLEENYSESLNESDLRDTVSNSMEDRHYASAQTKTTPYVTKESLSESGKQASSYGYTDKNAFNAGGEYGCDFFGGGGFNIAFNYGQSREHGENSSVENSFSTATMAEKTVFKDIDYVDNLDRNGIEFTSESVQKISTNFRKSKKLKETEKIGPRDGYVRASLYLKNLTINMPARISNVVCTLSFRTPAGQFLPVKTFRLRNDDYTEFQQEIYGGQELGPYTIAIENLNTREVMKALASGYVPQIHVVNYDICRVDDSNYNPGVENLKVVEEKAKGRTATIKIIGSGMREIHRVTAFDTGLPDTLTGERELAPGISLKKALFLVLRDRVGGGESWQVDQKGEGLTVPDEKLEWKQGISDGGKNAVTKNRRGNSWRRFETYVKTYVDRFNNECQIETIKRIDGLSKYNPFNPADNPSYNPNELLSRDEVSKMKFWVILHNGRYFEGDINDPIWAGERYEIICMDMADLNERFENFAYAPFQSRERIFLDTRWNNLTEEKKEFARAVYLGKVLSNEVITLEVDLLRSRYLFDRNEYKKGFGDGERAGAGQYFYNFAYTFENEEKHGEGIPEIFSHSAEGGTNSIRVAVNESKNAGKYRIEVYEKGKRESTLRVLEVSAELLAARDNIIVVDSNNDPRGGLPGSAAGVEYRVEVTALGTCYGETVERRSDRIVSAFVTEAAGKPGGFDFSARGETGAINVSIADSTDAEYFLVKIRGPYNYRSPGEELPENIRKGARGFNRIEIPAPERERLEENSFEPGLYSVQVFARNRHCSDDSVSAYSNTVWVKAGYDRYGNQRRFAPRISHDLHDFSAVDLEVNFNDGNGWFKLQTVDPYAQGNRGDYDETRSIDCFYSSYMEQDKRKFFIRFYPPNERISGMPNVFFGGREVADVYIRTVARREYRDTFWMRPEITDENIATYSSYGSAERFLFFDFFFGEGCLHDNVVDYWIGLESTDATLFEESLGSFYATGNISSAKQDDYFFSPGSQHLYAVRGHVSSEMSIIQGYRPGKPSLVTTPPFPLYHPVPAEYAYDRIEINNVFARRATGYEIFCIEGIIDYGELQRKADADKTGAQWVADHDWLHTPSIPASVNSLTLGGLKADTCYTVCAAARNKYGLSVPECTVVSIPKIPAEAAGKPEIGAPGENDDTEHISVKRGEVSIVNINAENATAFKAYWKPAGRPGDDVLSPPWKPAEVAGSSLRVIVPENVWGPVTVRVYALNSDNVAGPAFFEKSIQPLVPDVLKSFTLGWEGLVYCYSSSGVKFYLSDMRASDFDLSAIPENAQCRVKVDWRILEGVVPENNQGLPLYIKTSGSLQLESLNELTSGFSFGENNCTNNAFPTDTFVLSAWVSGARIKQYLKDVTIQVTISISGDISQSKTSVFTLPNLEAY